MSTAPEAITVNVQVHPDALRMLHLQAEMLECANRLKADGVLPPELGECLLNFCPVFFGAIRVLLDSPGVVPCQPAPSPGRTFLQELKRIADGYEETL
jgi:hypothetical protein